MLTLASCVRLAPGTRLQHDAVRQRWVLLGPERLLVLDDMARLILERSGDQTIGALCEALAGEFDAPLDTIQADVLALFSNMVERGFVRYE
ncbi:pyrroloquinoline quinone biosynthesis peptide chaperone PqqD [Cupriavidus taiwanensis]|uniref:pyrroloquinoline quinone biosynthesis peptide chaperone PqqD n=1 Tax=Cupriavidus taiwanensis TaxID=164546 RepID=UPI000E186AD9|nr:pyrroloquinoline quinone biosynthesis peptide chaperone PqqD [Cupriavidus taiwanensis]SPC18049.1 Coenzyme PQQ synthesis protein D [Cupriavidus taiwanensis]